jgi:DNA-binding GntR family transcriptional regulator
MIRLSVSEQELFDLIMALYLDAAAELARRSPEAAERREALLEKLHNAFDDKVLLAEFEGPQPIPARVGTLERD